MEASSYGANDVVLEFLVTSGLWGLLVSMEPDGLHKDNGKPWWALDAVEVLRELAGVDRIAHCGKLLRDVRLMMMAGFNAQAVSRAKARDRPVVDPETLANHLARISPRSAARTFLDHVALMRRKRWLRGGVYVADAHEIIIPYGRRSERLGRVGEKHGYKLVILLNTAEGRERVVGYVLAPLQCGERAMLRMILRALDTLAGRRFNAFNARIAFALMLYNADRLLRMKCPDLWEEAHRRRLALGGRDRLAGPSVAAYTPQGQLGVFTPAQSGQLAADRERNRIVHALREGLARGETLERVLGRLESEPPRDAWFFSAFSGQRPSPPRRQLSIPLRPGDGA